MCVRVSLSECCACVVHVCIYCLASTRSRRCSILSASRNCCAILSGLLRFGIYVLCVSLYYLCVHVRAMCMSCRAPLATSRSRLCSILSASKNCSRAARSSSAFFFASASFATRSCSASAARCSFVKNTGLIKKKKKKVNNSVPHRFKLYLERMTLFWLLVLLLCGN